MMIVMICGFVMLIVLFVQHFQAYLTQTPAARLSALSEGLALPKGARVQAITLTNDKILALTDAEKLYIFSAESAELLRVIALHPTAPQNQR